MAYIDFDPEDYIDDIDTSALIKEIQSRARTGKDKEAADFLGEVANEDGEKVSEAIFRACRIGDKERVFDLAFEATRRTLGRVC